MSEFLHIARMTAWAALIVLCIACRAQVRNGDRIQADPYLEYSAELRALVPMETPDPNDRITGIGETDSGASAESAEAAEPPTYDPDPERVLEALSGAGNVAARNDRGVARAKLLDLDLAEAEFRDAMRGGGGNVLPFTNLARLYVLVGEDERARNVYGDLTATDAVAADALYERALAYERQRRFTEATLIMEALVNRKLRTIDSALWLAAAAMRANDFGRARNYYDAVLALDAKNPHGLFGRGYISYLAQDYEDAMLFLGLARDNGSREPQLPYYLTHALFQEKEYDRALAVARSTQNPSIELIALHGRVRLILDYRDDLSDLLRQVSDEKDRAMLRRAWFGDEDLRSLPELRREFEYLY